MFSFCFLYLLDMGRLKKYKTEEEKIEIRRKQQMERYWKNVEQKRSYAKSRQRKLRGVWYYEI